MKLLLFVVVVGICDIAASLTPFQLRYKISKTQCAPVKGFERKTIPCYDFRNKKLVDPKDCGNKAYSHCCIYKCSCIVKGAGTSQGIIPEEYKLSKIVSSKKNVQKQARLLENCLSDSSTISESYPKKITSKIPTNDIVIKKLKSSVEQKKHEKMQNKKTVVKKPKTKSVNKQELNKTRQRPSVNKPLVPKSSANNKFSKKTDKGKSTNQEPTFSHVKPTKKPCVTKTTKPSFSFGFFSRLSFMMDQFGFNSNVVKNDSCA
ncbi:uncharacterized protein LOC144431909 [Styela clava]